jgi:hypothetical protein
MMCLPRVLRRAAPALCAVTLIACSNSGIESAQPPGTVCPAIVQVASATLVQPANGATSASITIGSVTASSSTDLTGAQLILTPAGGATFDGGLFGAVSGTTASATVPLLAAHTSYTVTASSRGPCPGTVFWSIGSFTTG